MDSRLKKMAVACAASVMLFVLVLVGYRNRDMLFPNRNQAQADPQEAVGQQENSSGLIYENGMIGNDLSAFLKDDTFFDTEPSYADELMEGMNRLSLIVTSVEKDLRIQIVNADNEPVTGESFFVSLAGVGEYKDLDKDGIIYIGELPAGDYEVSLKPIEGYRVPSGQTKVRVKEKVEYVVIDDISLLVRTEEEIDAIAEDAKEVVEDGDDTEIKRIQAVSAGSVLGIDVSKWQGEIDWFKVREAGIEYAIIRCGYRGSVTGALVEDPCFEQNIKGARAAGIKVGVYFYTQAVTEVEAVEEASMVISLIKDYVLDYPVFIDTEAAKGDGRANGLDAETRTVVCEAFCRTVENAGYEAGIYASRNWYNQRLQATRLEKYVIWLAEYRSVPQYQGFYQMWQYTSKGRVDGIEGNVDLDISYLGY